MTVAKLAGHRDAKITLSTYAHMFDSDGQYEVSPAQVVSLDLRRAKASGDWDEILDAVETALNSREEGALREQIAETFYSRFWFAAERPDLFERLGLLDARLCALY